MKPSTHDVYGLDLLLGDTLVQAFPDGTFDIHRIDRIAEYPGRYISHDGDGDHARIAYGAGNQWRHTIGDRETFHVLDPAPALITPAEVAP
jgi:hypothetical protein